MSKEMLILATSIANGPYKILEPAIKSKKVKTVKHQETCPICGRKLVNIYFKNNQWKCKQCWDKED